jgi:S1-C subfamily serine protease
VVDSIGGAAVSVISVLLIGWLIATAVAYAPFPLISRQVNNSAVLRGVDQIMPADVSLMFTDFRKLLARGPYTQVFGALGAEGTLRVPAPDPTVLSSVGLTRARPSIVKIEGTAPSCSRRIEGSGFVFARHRVLTNAHVVAGVAPSPEVMTTRGRKLRARVVLYDPLRDVAVLYVPGLHARPLSFTGPAQSGENAIVAGYPLNRSFTANAARIGGTEAARSPDIYQNTEVTREIYSIKAQVRPGNSGGPLLAPDGQVYGVVFAAAVSVKNTGYALTADEVMPDVQAGKTRVAPVSTQGCDS